MNSFPNVSAARMKLDWYFRFTNSFEIPGYVWNLCLFFRCFFDARWASQEQSDWQFTLQCTQFHSLRSLATICLSAFWFNCSSILAVNCINSWGGSNGGIWLFVVAGFAWWPGTGWTGFWGGGTSTGIGLYRFAVSTCFSLVTWSSHSS